MTSIQYDDIFNSFLGNVTDYELAALTVSNAYENMTEWLHKAVSTPYLRRLFSSIVLDDDTQVMTYELAVIVDDESDKEFVISMLGKQMVYEWIHPRVNNVSNLNMFFGNKDQKFFSQAQHLSELRGIEEDAYNSVRRMIRDRTYIWNDYIGGAS